MLEKPSSPKIKWYGTSGKLLRAVQEIFPYDVVFASAHAYAARPMDWDVLDWGKDNIGSMGGFKTSEYDAIEDKSSDSIPFSGISPFFISFDERADFLYHSIIGAYFKNDADAILFKLRWC